MLHWITGFGRDLVGLAQLDFTKLKKISVPKSKMKIPSYMLKTIKTFFNLKSIIQ